ncbi:hypothetical protein ACFL3V_00820 [Nanoarchaeota archaeon]
MSRRPDQKIYVKKVLEQVPRLIAQLDRNPFSPTYGCFDWNYWHDKIVDSPSAHTQENVLVLAYLYMNKLVDNPYYNNDKVKDWIIAAMLYWTQVQHRDGSFDEFYVNERQLGATAITLYAVMKSFIMIKGKIAPEDAKRILAAATRSARLLAKHDETHLLSNHQSQVIMALLLVQKVTKVSFSKAIRSKLKRIITGQSKDGWFREYTGADLGYLTTTIAFLAEYYLETKDRSLLDPLKQAVEFTGHFIYPDGTFGGVVGSRNTAHFWPSGFEMLDKAIGGKFPLAGAIADKALEFMEAGSLLTPEKEDRYFGEQMYDLLWAFMNHSSRGSSAELPFEQKDFLRYFEDSRMLVVKKADRYAIISAGKGGILKLFDIKKKRIVKSNCGLVGRLSDKTVVATNFNDETYKVKLENDLIRISGRFHAVSFSNMSPFKMSVFKTGMLVLGRTMSLSNFIKDVIIKKLITGDRKVDILFSRTIDLNFFKIEDEIVIKGGDKFRELSCLDESKLIFVAYSKYFNESELGTRTKKIGEDEIEMLNTDKSVKLVYDNL